MRYFKLINSKGEKLDITTQELFFHEVTGLGYEENTSFRAVGDIWWLNNVSYRQQIISGKMSFTEYGDSDPYDKFYNFVRFIENAPLILLYYPYGPRGDEYRRRVRVSKLEKSEKTKYGILEEEIEFTPYTLWYNVITADNGVKDDQVIQNTTGWVWGGNDNPPLKFEPVEGSLATPAKFRGEVRTFVNVIVDTSNKNPVKLMIHGPVTNPTWTHYVDDILVASGGFNTGETVNIAADEVLVVDNTDGLYSITAVNIYTNAKRNLYALRNFNTACFLYLKSGVNQIMVSSSNGNVGKIELEGHLYHAAV